MSEYTLDLQKLFVEFMVNDQDLFVSINGICESRYFDKSLRKGVDFIKEHANEYGASTHEQIVATTGLQLEKIPNVDDRHKEWFIDEFEKSPRHKALEGAIPKSTDLIEKSDYGAVEKIIKDAVQIGLAKHMGLDYWANPGERIEHVRKRGGVSTGWTKIDSKLYGGFNRGELNIFAAQLVVVRVCFYKTWH